VALVPGTTPVHPTLPTEMLKVIITSVKIARNLLTLKDFNLHLLPMLAFEDMLPLYIDPLYL
jgi:hypothetical protein